MNAWKKRSREQTRALAFCRQKSAQVLAEAIGSFAQGIDGLPRTGLIFAAGPLSHFHQEIWMRDASFAICTVLAADNPQATVATLKTLMEYESASGIYPLRVEAVRHWGLFVPGLRHLGAFTQRRRPFAVYENVKGALPARDTVPALILACSCAFSTSSQGRELVIANWERLKAAMAKEGLHEENGLICGGSLQDWADSVMRPGQLSSVNILYYQALCELAKLAAALGEPDQAAAYLEKARTTKERILAVFWDEKGGYVRAEPDCHQLDVPATTFACLFLLTPEQAARAQDSISKRALARTGLLKNFEPTYPIQRIAMRYRIGRIADYHTNLTWPWVTLHNVLAKLKVAAEHPDQATQERFAREALCDFHTVSLCFLHNQQINEILDAKTGSPARREIRLGSLKITTYRSSPSFLGSAAAYVAADRALTAYGLLPKSLTPLEG